MRRLLIAGSLLLASLPTPLPLSAQAPADAKPRAFDVASVKPNRTGDGRVTVGGQQGRFTAMNITPFMLIRQAYQVQPYQIVDGPSWLKSDRFDIVAKGDASTPEQMQLMMRALLADRFKLAVHTDNRELPMYSLVMVRRGSRLGPQLNPSMVDCAALNSARRGTPPPPSSASSSAGRPTCGIRIVPGSLVAGGISIEQLASALVPWVNRTIVDDTELASSYDVDLHWTPEQPSGLANPEAPPLPAVDQNGPSIFTALQEQLGLKLESKKDKIDVLIIDRVEDPSED